MLRSAMLCYAVLCYTVLCFYGMLCFGIDQIADLSAVLFKGSHQLLLPAHQHCALLFLQLHVALKALVHHKQLLCSIFTSCKLTLQQMTVSVLT